MGTPTFLYKPVVLLDGEVTVFECCKIDFLFFILSLSLLSKISFKFSFITTLNPTLQRKRPQIWSLHYFIMSCANDKLLTTLWPWNNNDLRIINILFYCPETDLLESTHVFLKRKRHHIAERNNGDWCI